MADFEETLKEKKKGGNGKFGQLEERIPLFWILDFLEAKIIMQVSTDM